MVLDVRQQVAARDVVPAQPIGDETARLVVQSSEQAPEDPLWGYDIERAR